jgi:hypothetical protein
MKVIPSPSICPIWQLNLAVSHSTTSGGAAFFKAGLEETLAEREKQRAPDWLPLDFTQPARDKDGPTQGRDFEPEQ